MCADLDLSPPEVPEPSFCGGLLRYGLFLGAIFQLICILALIRPTSHGQLKGPVQQIRQKVKKESKKKR